MPVEPYAIEYTDEALRHIRAIDAKQRSLIRQALDEQLRYEPHVQTRNRKPLFKPAGRADATWEVRCGPNNSIRVFYQVNMETRVVSVVAIAVKRGNSLFIGDEEFTP